MRTRKPFWLCVWMVCALIGIGVVSACVPGFEQNRPIIVLDPVAGGPGTSVAVRGSGFPAQIQVSVRLGPPSIGATPLSYGDATTDAEGTFYLAFTMPLQWPDGTLITETDLVVVALNEDGSIKAIAPFGYIPPSLDAPTAVPDTTEAHQQVVLAWRREGDAAGFCGDVMVYASGYAEIASCQEAVLLARRLLSEDMVDRLHAWTSTYRSFEVERTSGTGDNRVLTRVTFVGNGSRQVSEGEIRTLQALLESLAASQ
jgi:hypothetical protein